MMEQTKLIDKLIDLAIEEDISTGDITTTSIIPKASKAVASMKAKASGVISGIEIVKKVFERFQKDIIWTPYKKNGDRVEVGDEILMIQGTYQALLEGERLSLNIFQRMCGIATETAKYVKEIQEFDTQILDTRKTAPGLRVLDKMAVKDGGGTNHRMGLYDMVMIKDNHIKMAGSITKAVEQVRKSLQERKISGNDQVIRVEVETTNLAEVREALEAGADIIMLDNMSNDMMSEAVKIIDHKADTEASGNMSVARLKGVAATGVDFISVGALTHSVVAMDISMNIKEISNE